MAAAPSSTTWAVTLSDTSNSWASGALVVDSNGGGTYKGNNNTVTWDSSSTIGWSVTVPHGGQNCTLVFSGGVISGTAPHQSMSGNGPTISCSGTPGSGNDTWSASETSMDPGKPGY